MKILFLTSHPIEAAASRYRAYQYMPYLAKEGIESNIRPFVSNKFYKILYHKGNYFKKSIYFLFGVVNRIFDLFRSLHYDLIFIQREAFPIGPPVIEFILSKILLRPIIYDFDDAIFLSESTGFFAFLKNPKKIKSIISWADYIIAGNEYLEKYALQFNKNVKLVPTAIDIKKYKCIQKDRDDKIILGWIGSHSTTKYLLQILPVLKKLAKEYSFEFKVIGAEKQVFIPGIKTINQKWALHREIQDVQELTIGIYPLPIDKWTQGKCGFKAIQYMAAGIPTIASAVGINNEIIKDGKNGFLANNEEDWIKKLSLLIENIKLRKQFSIAGRKTVDKKYSAEVTFSSILQIINQFKKVNMMQLISKLDIGGTEKMLIELLKKINKNKYNITVCLIDSGLLEKEVRQIDNISVINLNIKSKWNILIFFKLLYLLKKNHITLIQSYLFFDNFFACILGKIANVPIIINGQRYLSTPNSQWKCMLNRYFSKYCDLIIANSFAAKKSLMYKSVIPGNKIKVIYNGKDLSKFIASTNQERIKKELGINKNDPVIGILARLHPIKNHDFFLDIASAVLKKENTAKFVIAGDGKLKPHLMKYAKKLNIKDSVIFTGNRLDIPEIISIFDIGMLTSQFESLPGSIIEYMALAKPVVATFVGGMNELILDKQTGFLGTTKEELVQNVLYLLKNKILQKKMGAAGRIRVEKYFTADRMVAEYEQTYDDLIRKKISQYRCSLPNGK